MTNRRLGKLVSEMLTLDGHTVVRVEGGRAAIVELGAKPLDVIVTDLKMPEVDGMSVLREARARAGGPGRRRHDGSSGAPTKPWRR